MRDAATANSEFGKEYLLEWSLTNKGLALLQIAKWYHDSTEAYDRQVCTGPVVKGCVLPRDEFERSLSYANARRTLSEAYARGASLGWTREEVRRTIRNYGTREVEREV